MQQDVMMQGLSRKEIQDLRNKRTGLAVFQFSWIMAFVCLCVVNLYLRGQYPSWPPPGVEQLNTLIPTAMTGVLLVSSFFVRRGVKAIRNDAPLAFLSQWRYALGLGALFVVVMALEWISVPFSGQYSSVFRLMIGFHGLHALVIGVILWRVYRHAQHGHYNSTQYWPVEGGAGLWYFVTIAWLLFFVVLYVI